VDAMDTEVSPDEAPADTDSQQPQPAGLLFSTRSLAYRCTGA